MYLRFQSTRICSKRLLKLAKLLAYNESTDLDQAIVGWEDIYLQNKKVKKLNILITKCFVN